MLTSDSLRPAGSSGSQFTGELRAGDPPFPIRSEPAAVPEPGSEWAADGDLVPVHEAEREPPVPVDEQTHAPGSGNRNFSGR